MPPASFGPVPSQKQLDWQEMEMYAFIHFTTNTFTNKEWGFGNEPEEIFNPTALDTRQWARVVKEASMKGIILTAKHHDGFCLWPSAYTDHSVEKSPWKDGKGDVVKELGEACREYGLKLGLYLSPWDRSRADYGKPEYVTYFRNQLKELLTNYGDVFEMWFDGANGGTGYYGGANESRKINTLEYYDWEKTYKMIYDVAPKTLVWGIGPSEARWIGNEEGRANKTNWSLLRQEDDLAGKVNYTEYMSGHEDGEKWVPGEADVSIRPGWFYHAVEDDKIKPVEELLDIYYESVGRNANLILNIPPDRRGLINEKDVERLHEFSTALKADFKTELLAQSTVSANQSRGNKFGPENLIDGDKNTYWATSDAVKTASITFDFDHPTAINRVLLQEYIKLGQRVRKFTVEAKIDSNWQTIADESTIGYKRILRFDRVTVTALRVNITDAKACPVISNIEAFNAPTLVRMPEISRSRNGEVTISAENADQIFYTSDGSEPNNKSLKYSKPFLLKNAVTVKAISFDSIEKISSAVKNVKYGTTKESWKMTEATGGNPERANRIIDGNPVTDWDMGNTDNMLPQEVKIDMGAVKDIKGFTYMPRQTGNGLNLISAYEFYTSLDGKKWVKRSEGEFANILNNPILQVKTFKKALARYIRFVAKSEVSGGNTVTIAELDVIEN
ncbi:MAG: alpha-L-fucosidase [Leeuwenhoekiella sp.]